MPDLLRRFIALVSRLAPGAMRREFRAEWEAELAASWRARPARSWKAGVRVVFRAAGAIPDAWFLNRQQWSADMLLQDVKYALRLLAHRRTYTLVVVATLAAGIGANAAMFSVINAVLLRPLPFREASRLVMVWENDRLNGKPRYLVAPANYDDWRRQSHSFTSLSAFVLQGGTITGGGEPFHASVAVVTPNFLDTLGVVPELGRGLTEADAPPAHRVLLLSHAAWLTHFGGDRGIVDRTVRLGDEAYRVVGVMPRGFEFPERRVDVWRPMALTPQLLATRAQHFLGVFGRLTPGTSLAAAAAELESVAVAAQQRYPETNSQRGTTMVPLQAAIVGDVQRPLYFLGAAVALLLLIACANVANLMVVQSASRRREMAMRAAVGADRFRIARQLLVEGMLLAAAGGAAGIALAAWGVQALGHLASRYIPRADSIALDTAVVAYAAVLSMVTALLFALVPALRASRTSFQRDLREGARGSVGTANRLRRLLVAIEFAAAVVLVAGAVLLLESFWRVLDVQPGFRTSQLLAIDVDVPQQKYGADGALAEFYANLVARLSAVPGVRQQSPAVGRTRVDVMAADRESSGVLGRAARGGVPRRVRRLSRHHGYSAAAGAMARGHGHGGVDEGGGDQPGAGRPVLSRRGSYRRARAPRVEPERAMAHDCGRDRQYPARRARDRARAGGVSAAAAESLREHGDRSCGGRSCGHRGERAGGDTLDRPVGRALAGALDGCADRRAGGAAAPVDAAGAGLRGRGAGPRAARDLRCRQLRRHRAHSRDRGADGARRHAR